MANTEKLNFSLGTWIFIVVSAGILLGIDLLIVVPWAQKETAGVVMGRHILLMWYVIIPTLSFGILLLEAILVENALRKWHERE